VLFFKKEIGSGTHSDRKFDEGGGVSYNDTRKKVSGTPLRFASFLELPKRRSGTKILLITPHFSLVILYLLRKIKHKIIFSMCSPDDKRNENVWGPVI
jgi:hypothetical protein